MIPRLSDFLPPSAPATRLGAILVILLVAGQAGAEEDPFRTQVGPILQRRCLSCHNDKQRKGELSLETARQLLDGYVTPKDVAGSELLALITPDKFGKAAMPKGSDPLSAAEIETIRRWIEAGAHWPTGYRLTPSEVASTDWWSWQAIQRPSLPAISAEDQEWTRTPIDAFVIAQQRRRGLAPSPVADRSTLIRRLSYDLLGLPPAPEEVAAFVADNHPLAYERLVERLLASPRYGERWARHWLDVVHYGDTHGYDKDKLRPHAWPYRDYVIRAFNDDTPYGEFVRQQVAGDVLYPKRPELIAATGFVAAGPWDFIGHVEVPATKQDGRVARNLDRDDMVVNTMQTFCSVTVGCARCHHHKFDPITQEDYYNLQAVFAGVGRNDRPYDVSQEVASRRSELAAKLAASAAREQQLDAAIAQRIAASLAELDAPLARLAAAAKQGVKRPEFGYHSAIEKTSDTTKWVQVDLGRSAALAQVVLIACHDDFAGIGAGFGFPVRYRVELCDDPTFEQGVITLVDRTDADVPNPGISPVELDAGGNRGRYLRVTATKLPNRLPADFIFCLSELQATNAEGENLAQGAAVTSLDATVAPPRWRRENLTDGVYYTGGLTPAEHRQVQELQTQRGKLIAAATTPEEQAEREAANRQRAEAQRQLDQLPAPGMLVYAIASKFVGSGGHQPYNDKPAPIYVLRRGLIDQHGELAQPAALRLPTGPPALFQLAAGHGEGERRAALAHWLADRRNPLTWRSIVNRVWQYHFGRGLVDSANDFGRMGNRPSHPHLLDWLASEFRDGGTSLPQAQSIKGLHRLIVTSAVYRQQAGQNDAAAKLDADNVYLWRGNRRRLEAEEIRDATLLAAGKLNLAMYGPGFQDFVVEQPRHSPQFNYEKHDPDDSRTHRRSIYRFLPRSQPQPFMQTLDCADPSQQVARRDETVTALGALAMLNNKFMVRMAEHFAARLEREEPKNLNRQIQRAFQLTLSRPATPAETAEIARFADQHGLASACRAILNLNEFVFVD